MNGRFSLMPFFRLSVSSEVTNISRLASPSGSVLFAPEPRRLWEHPAPATRVVAAKPSSTKKSPNVPGPLVLKSLPQGAGRQNATHWPKGGCGGQGTGTYKPGAVSNPPARFDYDRALAFLDAGPCAEVTARLALSVRVSGGEQMKLDEVDRFLRFNAQRVDFCAPSITRKTCQGSMDVRFRQFAFRYEKNCRPRSRRPQKMVCRASSGCPSRALS